MSRPSVMACPVPPSRSGAGGELIEAATGVVNRDTGDGLDIIATPKGFAVEAGEEPKTVRVLALGDNRYVAAEPDGGVHPVIAFLEDGRYLYTGRAIKRV